MRTSTHTLSPINMKRRDSPSTNNSLSFLIISIALSILAAYFLVSFQYNPYEQDAAQYQLNLETGLYDRSRDQGKSLAFATTVGWLSAIRIQDPFFALGVMICASYIFRAINLRVSALKWGFFAIMMFMPPVYMNYTQVIRQGVAGAIILNGLTLSSSWLLFLSLLGVGALFHQTFAPFSGIMLIREFFSRSRWPQVRVWAPLLDKAVFVALPIATVFIYMFGDVILGQGRTEVYFSVGESSLKRITVSLMLLACAAFLYDKNGSRLTYFTVCATIFVAFAIPFAFDFLRLQTFMMPFLLMSCLEIKDWRRVVVVGAIAILISVYVTPQFGISAVL